MGSNKYKRDFYDYSNLPYRNLVTPELFTVGNATDGHPGSQQAVRNIIADKEGNYTFIISGFNFTPTDSNSVGLLQDSYAVVTGTYTEHNSGIETDLADEEHLFLKTDGTFANSSSSNEDGILLGKREGSSFIKLANQKTGRNGRWTYRHTEDQYFYGQLEVREDATLRSGLYVTGDMVVRSHGTIQEGLEVSGTSRLYGNVYTTGNLEVTGTSILKDNVYAKSNLGVTGSSTLKGDVHTAGNLEVTGTSTLKGNVNAHSNILANDGTVNIGADGSRFSHVYTEDLSVTNEPTIGTQELSQYNKYSNDGFILPDQKPLHLDRDNWNGITTRIPKSGDGANGDVVDYAGNATSDKPFAIQVATATGLILGIYNFGDSPGYTAGDPLYLQNTDGDIGVSPGDVSRPIGSAISSSGIYFNPSNVEVE